MRRLRYWALEVEGPRAFFVPVALGFLGFGACLFAMWIKSTQPGIHLGTMALDTLLQRTGASTMLACWYGIPVWGVLRAIPLVEGVVKAIAYGLNRRWPD